MNVHEMKRDIFGFSNLEDLKGAMPDFAKDIKLNLSSVLREAPESGLTQKQIAAIALSSAYTTRQHDVIAALEGEFRAQFSDAELNAVKSAVTIMGMNNIYYRFLHLVENKDYQRMPAGLRMNVIANPGIEKIDFELCSLAVSAINGCGMCIESHVAQIEKHGTSQAGVQHAIKISAVVNAAAQALEMIE